MEKHKVYQLFDYCFSKYKNTPIVLYGLGVNTKYLLEENKDYNIVGITANDKIGEVVYDKEVMPIEAIPGKAKIIVIIAQAKSIKTIYERIKHIEDTGIMIFDLYGRMLKEYYDNKNPNADNCPSFESASAMDHYERLLCSSVADAARHAVNKCDYNVLHLFADKAFKDPLSFVESKGKLKISNMYELGYFCFGPITASFLAWMVKEVGNDENSIVLFSSRDGYLLYKLYQHIKCNKPELMLPNADYFYISRRAATVACIQNESDIAEIVTSVLNLSMGSLRETLEQRLGMTFDKNDPILDRSLTDVLGKNEIHEILARVLDHKSKILKNAAQERKNYLKYLQKSNINSYENIFIFDLYPRGTNVSRLNILLGRKVNLLCFAVKDFPNEYINSQYKYKSMFDSKSIMSGEWFRRGYQLFETVYSSPEGQLMCFDKYGLPLFTENSQYSFNHIKEAQKGITAFINDLDAFDDKWYRSVYSLDLVDFMSSIMTRKYSVVSPDIRNGFFYYDSFSAEKTINIWDSIV